MRRRSKKEAERESVKRNAWPGFCKRLAEVQSFPDAEAIVRDAPPESHAARPFYSNLGFFLQTFGPPGSASQEEIALYIALLDRINAAGQLKPGAYDPLRAALQAAMTDGSPSRFRLF